MDIKVNEPIIKTTGRSTVEMNKEMRTFIILSINKIAKGSEDNVQESSEKNYDKKDELIIKALLEPMSKYIEYSSKDLKEDIKQNILKNDENKLKRETSELLIQSLAKKWKNLENEEDINLHSNDKLKICDLCGDQFIPKRNQKYCARCQKYLVPMYRDLKRNRDPIYDYGDIKSFLLSTLDKSNDIAVELFFINKALTLDYNAMIQFRAAKAAGYFESLRKIVLKQWFSGLTSEIIQQTSLNYSKIVNDAILMVNFRLSKSIFADFVGPIYLKSCKICGEPLITLKPLNEKSKTLFKDCLDDWAVKKVLPEDELEKIKKALVSDKKPQTKYHPHCKRYKNADYQRDYKRKRRKKERELMLNSVNMAYNEHGSLMNQYNPGKGTINVSAERKESDESEQADINRIFRKLGLRPTFK